MGLERHIGLLDLLALAMQSIINLWAPGRSKLTSADGFPDKQNEGMTSMTLSEAEDSAPAIAVQSQAADFLPATADELRVRACGARPAPPTCKIRRPVIYPNFPPRQHPCLDRERGACTNVCPMKRLLFLKPLFYRPSLPSALRI